MGYIFEPKKGIIDLKCTFSSNKNPYIQAQQKVFKLIEKYRKFKLNLSNLIFMQIESPLRHKHFFIKKVCIAAKNKRKIEVGNIHAIRDYSWITDIVKGIYLISNLKSKNYIISSGTKLTGINVMKFAYRLNKLNYKNYYSIEKKFLRKEEDKILIGSKLNSLILKKKYNFKFKIVGTELIKKMYKSI